MNEMMNVVPGAANLIPPDDAPGSVGGLADTILHRWSPDREPPCSRSGARP